MENESNVDRKRYRIDLLKVKQKLFDSYPANSIHRKNLIKEEKSKELAELASGNQFVSKSVANKFFKVAKIQLQNHILKATVGLLVMVVSGILFVRYAKSIVELFSTLMLGLAGVYFGIKYTLESIADWVTMRRFRIVHNKIHDRIDQLKRDILG